MDLDEIKLKTASQLKDNERDYLRQNVDKLNDEDKQAYADILNTETENQIEVQTETETTGGDKGTGVATGDSTKDNGSAVVQNPPTGYAFKSEEDAKEFVRKQLEDKEAKQKAIDAAQTPEEKRYVEENWRPEDWNVAAKTFVKIAKEEIKAEAEAEAKRVEENGKRLDKEWKELSQEHNIPGLNTKEGKKIHADIIQVGLSKNKTTFKDAYAEYIKIPKEFGGGYDPIKVAEELKKNEQKEHATSYRQAATKIGGQNAGAGSVKGSASLKPISYEDLKKPRQKLIREATHG